MGEIPLPHEGRWQHAPEKKFQETIVFVHHFGGNRSSTKRHQDMVNGIGFDSVSFNMGFNSEPSWKNPWAEFGRLVKATSGTSWQAEWTKELIEVLDAIPGKKILYTFSSPSVSVVRAVVDERRDDIKAWICDGGPFLQAYSCLLRYYKYQTRLPAWIHPLGAGVAFMFIGGIGFVGRTRRWMKTFPSTIPILSIRAGRDRLVPPAAIEDFFSSGEQLNLAVLNLPEADHLEGLKNFPSIYIPAVTRFLTESAANSEAHTR